MTRTQAIALRRAIRLAVGVKCTATPIEYVMGSDAPRVVGDPWHYETTDGTWIRHPSAYRRRGWSSARYVPSTRRIVVGVEWTP